MPPTGRRVAERNVFSFEGRLLAPPELVIDTSFVVDALVTKQPRHDACRAFLDTIRDSGSLVYFNTPPSPVLSLELYSHAMPLREIPEERLRALLLAPPSGRADRLAALVTRTRGPRRRA